jgi:outer membrane protein assembly factor BamB
MILRHIYFEEQPMKAIVAVLTVVVCAAAAHAAEPLVWPQFRGPSGSGVADGQKPPVQLGVDKNVKWKVPVPSGLSSPIVAGDKLVITAFENDKLYTIAYNRADGKVAWRAAAPARTIEPFYKAEGSPAASTPATDGERIVSFFGSYGLICYDLAGKELWKFEVPASPMPGNFGTGTSPILSDGLAIIVHDEIKNPRIIAVDAATGSFKWEKKRRSICSYATPVVWETPEGKQIVTAGHARMDAYDLQSGDEKWSLNGLPSGCTSSPVAVDGTLYFAGWSPGGADDPDPKNKMPSFDDLLKQLDKDKDGAISREEGGKQFEGFFDSMDANKDGKITRDEYEAVLKFMAAGKNSAFALRPGGKGDVTESHVVWKKTKGLPYIPSALVYRGQMVMVKDGGLVSALDAKTGQELYLQERAASGGRYYASPVAANGHIYLIALDDGAITVLRAGAAKPEALSKNQRLGERVAATPAIADDTLYVRGEKHLWAFSEKK